MLSSRCCALLVEQRALLLGPRAPPTRAPPSQSGGGATHSQEAADGPDNDNTSAWGPSPDARLEGEERFSLTSVSESDLRTPACRICFQGPEHGELLSACRCCGSVRYTHQPCLVQWISERGCWACELCYHKYRVLAIGTKNPLQWQAISLTVMEKVQIAAAVLGSLFLVASVSWLVWSSFAASARWQRQDLLFQICYGMYGFMDVVCIALLVHEGPSVFRSFHRWRAVNQQWKVLNYDQSQDPEAPRDPEEPRDPEAPRDQDRTLYQPNAGGWDSVSSLTETTSSLAGSLISVAVATSGAGLPDQGGGPGLLPQLRGHQGLPDPRGGARELVMRVTTV